MLSGELAPLLRRDWRCCDLLVYMTLPTRRRAKMSVEPTANPATAAVLGVASGADDPGGDPLGVCGEAAVSAAGVGNENKVRRTPNELDNGGRCHRFPFSPRCNCSQPGNWSTSRLP